MYRPVELPASAVLHEDLALLAVDKPAGLVVVPARDEPPEHSLRHRLQALRGEALWVVHRLDRDTSGVVLFARTAAAHRALSLAFERREVRKRYVAVTRGVPEPAHGTCATPLHAARKGKMRPAHPGEPGALACETEYAVDARWDTALGPVAWVDAAPRTGRQHQVRVHLRSLGAPLLVDPLYGGAAAREAGALGAGSPPLARLTLHARRIELAHPADGRPLTIDAPQPADLADLRAWLDGSATDQS